MSPPVAGYTPSRTNDSIAISGSMGLALRKARTLRPVIDSIPLMKSSRIPC